MCWLQKQPSQATRKLFLNGLSGHQSHVETPPSPGSRLRLPSHLWQRALCFIWPVGLPKGLESPPLDMHFFGLYVPYCPVSPLCMTPHKTRHRAGAANTRWRTRLIKSKLREWLGALSDQDPGTNQPFSSSPTGWKEALVWRVGGTRRWDRKKVGVNTWEKKSERGA